MDAHLTCCSGIDSLFDSLENFHVTLQNMHFRKNNLSKPPSSVLLWKSPERQIRSRERNLSPWPLSQRLPLETPFAAQPHPSLQGLWKHWPRHIPWGTARKSSPDFFRFVFTITSPSFSSFFIWRWFFLLWIPPTNSFFVGGGGGVSKRIGRGRIEKKCHLLFLFYDNIRGTVNIFIRRSKNKQVHSVGIFFILLLPPL